MKNELPHITVGQSEVDPFLTGERSKTKEHTDRLRSDLFQNNNFENFQKLMKNEENPM